MKIIEAIKGDDLKLLVEITTDAGEIEDITGGTLQLIVKTNLSDADTDAVANQTATVFNAPASGSHYFTINTEDWEPRQYYAQIKYRSAGLKNNFSDEFRIKINSRVFDES